ncbi:MAG: Trm112 family protein [Candidatus Omnitrophica bacterium]|nr:Trm112 family protein [Candidatus Omnitrophota bacterium]
MIDPELLNILACPICKKEVKLQNDFLVCEACRKRYPIKDGIPIMLVEEAQSY